jgi:hypothetical protein
MSARRLRLIVIAVIGFLLLYAGGAAIAYAKQQHSAALYFKDFLPAIIGTAAAILTAAFQRRISYLQALRELWKQLLPAIQIIIQYTHAEPPASALFAKAQEAISIAIDAVRGVFRNIPGAHSGLYPYENLKDIKRILDALDPCVESLTPERRKLARRVITRLWQETHAAMLPEFDRAIPFRPVSKYLCHGKSIADYFVKNKLEEHHLDKEEKPSCPKLLPDDAANSEPSRSR